VVAPQIRGQLSSKKIKMVEWCGCIARLEPFFSDSHPLEAPGVELSTYPHTCPHSGDTMVCQTVLCSPVFCRGLAAVQHPRLRSVLWLARRDVGGCRARQKPPSSLTRTRVSGRTGFRVRTGKGHACPLYAGTGLDGFGSRATKARVSAKDLRAFCACRAIQPRPRYPRRLETLRLETSQDFGRGRTGEPEWAFLQVFRNPLPLH